MTYLRTLVIAIGVTFPALALAQQGGGARGAYMADVKSLCGSIQPGGGRIIRCMREHREKISEGCKPALAERRMQRGQNRPGRGLGTQRPARTGRRYLALVHQLGDEGAHRGLRAVAIEIAMATA